MEIARRVLVLVFLALAWPAGAQSVGRVQFASGEVAAERAGQRIVLAAGSELERGDLVVTGPDGHLQVRMVDSAHLSLRPRSRMRIDAYQHDPSRRGNVEALLTLLTGAMHAFTGDIAEQRRDRFRMRTPLASVGIRGSGNILAHLEESGTINHTLTGAHSVTAIVGGVERTLISYPGQTVLVRAGLPPRYIPTPPLIMAAAAPTRASGGGAAPAPDTAGPSAAAMVNGTGPAVVSFPAASTPRAVAVCDPRTANGSPIA